MYKYINMSGAEVIVVVVGIAILVIRDIMREKKCKSRMSLENDVVQAAQTELPNVAQDIQRASSLVQLFKNLTPRRATKPQVAATQPSQSVQPTHEIEMTRQPSVSLS
jgi:hypothetical protein